MKQEQKILSDITTWMKYSKFLPEKNRRETWEELVTRNKQMHIDKFPDLAPIIEQVYELVYDKKVLPSMRSLQFGGKAIEVNPVRLFNCSYLPIDHFKAFSETMFLLLSSSSSFVIVAGVRKFSVPRAHGLASNPSKVWPYDRPRTVDSADDPQAMKPRWLRLRSMPSHLRKKVTRRPGHMQPQEPQ